MSSYVCSRSFAVVAVAAASVSLWACKGKSSDSTKVAKPEATQVRPPSEAGGEGPAGSARSNESRLPAVVVSVWLEHWPALAGTTREWAKLDEEVAQVLSGVDMTSPWRTIGPLARLAGLDKLTAMPPGIDGSRPMTLEVFPSHLPFEEVMVAGWRALKKGTASVGAPVRLRVTIPARAGDELAKALTEALTDAFGGSVEGAGQDGLYAGKDMWVRLTRLPADVVLEFFPAQISKDVSAQQRLAMFGPAPTRPAEPAFASTAASALRIAGHARGLGEVGPSTGAMVIFSVLEEAPDAEMGRVWMLQGMAELLGGFLLMDPQTSMASSAFLHVPADEGSRPQMALRLTAAGGKALSAGGLPAGKSGGEPVSAGSLDWNKVVSSAQLSPALARAEDRRDVVMMFQECGWTCLPYLWLGNAIPMAAVLQKTGMLDRMVGAVAEEAKGLLKAAKAIQMQRSGDVLMVGARGDAFDPAWKTLPTAAAPVPSTDAAERCLRQAWVEVRLGIQSIAEDEPAQKLLMLGRAEKAIAEHGECARKDPSIARRYDAMQAFVDEIKEYMKQLKSPEQ